MSKLNASDVECRWFQPPLSSSLKQNWGGKGHIRGRMRTNCACGRLAIEIIGVFGELGCLEMQPNILHKNDSNGER